MAGAPFGNQNARKGKSWLDALRLEIAIDDGARLESPRISWRPVCLS